MCQDANKYTVNLKEMVRVTTCVVSPVTLPWHYHGISMAMSSWVWFVMELNPPPTEIFPNLWSAHWSLDFPTVKRFIFSVPVTHEVRLSNDGSSFYRGEKMGLGIVCTYQTLYPLWCACACMMTVSIQWHHDQAAGFETYTWPCRPKHARLHG